jgi:hypothetical protein
MKSLSYQDFLKKLSGNGKVIFDKKTFYLQGLFNQKDLMIKGTLKKTFFQKPILVEYKNKEKPKRVTSNIKEQIKLIEELLDVDYITSFNLSKYLIKKIKAVIRKYNVTHMRFYTIKDKVKLNIFDFRTFINETQLPRQNSIKLFDLPNVQTVEEPFSRTLNTESFLIIPDEDMSLTITKSHNVIFNDLKNSWYFLISHQDFSEPITHFFNPKINESVSFLYTKSTAIRNTQINV